MNILIANSNEAKLECYDVIDRFTPLLMICFFFIGMMLFSKIKNKNKAPLTDLDYIEEKTFFHEAIIDY